MIDSSQWPSLVYRNPKRSLTRKKPLISNIFGIDSEALTTGEPFILCTSEGDTFDPKEVPACFFKTPKYHNANFTIYNMKYDSGAILYHLPRPVMHELWANGEVDHDNYTYSYIPHKLLRIRKGKIVINFWDISQFFKMSLDKAGKTYLSRGKIDIATKSFTPVYVKRFKKSIIKYCIADALLTKDLALYFIEKMKTFDISIDALYSCASISLRYFNIKTKINTVWKHYNVNPLMLQMACDAYEGGKFEMTARGAFSTVYEYDISSAYPYEIMNLCSIEHAEIHYSSTYSPDALYGFYRVWIDNSQSKHLPCGMKLGNVRIYPSGQYYLTITKEEYEYITNELCLPVHIFKGVNIYVKRKVRPYKKPIEELFSIKTEYKGKDKMIYNGSKTIMNSYYGKTCQCIEQPGGDIIAGVAWNPVHASVITANTRIKVARMQNLLQEDCYAVHTDSIMVSKELPRSLIQTGLGEFEYVEKGPAVLIACGQYQIDGEHELLTGRKGIKFNPGDDWRIILKKNLNRSVIKYKQLHVESWVESMAKNHAQSKINVFNTDIKKIDLNADTKRIWEKPFKCKDLLTEHFSSNPKIVHQNDPPKNFLNKS
jgi:hypothetical protein